VGTATLQEVNKQESGGGTREHVETLGEEYIAAMQGLGGITREHVETVVQSQVGESGRGFSQLTLYAMILSDAIQT
jgi:hypothetical protein